MRLTRLEAQNVLSFDKFELDLDPRRTVIVGPNGSGKTNLTRLLALMGSALAWVETEGPRGSEVAAGTAAQILNGFARARHQPDSGKPQVVRLGLELTKDWERDLMVAFVRAAVLWSLNDSLHQGDQHLAPLADWAMETITAGTCADLFAGTLVAEHPGVRDRDWEVGFEFSHGDPGEGYRWVLQAPEWHSTVLTARDAASPPAGLPGRTDILAQRLLGVTPGGSPLTKLPGLAPFGLDLICPKPSEAIRLVVGQSGQYLDLGVAPYRAFVELGQFARPAAPSPGLSLATVLTRIYGTGLVLVGEQLRGVGTWGAQLAPAGRYTWDDVAAPFLSRDPHLLPLRLLRLKTGSADERRRFGRIQSAFSRLAPGREFDLRFAAGLRQVAAGKSAEIPEVAIDVLVSTGPSSQGSAVTPDSQEQPIQLHGAGTWEALMLADALQDAAGRVVVLDEPATVLHPTWQRSLASQLQESEAQLLMITHSPDLVRVRDEADVHCLVRLSLEEGETRVHQPGAVGTIPNLPQLLRMLALSGELRSCLFARAVVLLEGETELGALPRWFARCAEDAGVEPPEALDLAFYQVGGDKGFASPLALIACLGLPCAIICDGAAFDLTKRENVFKQVAEAGADSGLETLLPKNKPRSMDAVTFKVWVKYGREHGIFTLANGWTTGKRGDETFEAFLDRTLPAGARDKAKEAVPKSKVRQGLWISDEYAPPYEITELYTSLVGALKRRGLRVP